MSDHKTSPLVAVSASLTLSKLANYQMNVYAEQVVRELALLEPQFLALFGIEYLL
jgi:hypothetical protein